MKRIAVFFIAVIILITAVSCSNRISGPEKTDNKAVRADSPTGPETMFPSPEVPYTMVVYDSRRWCSFGYDIRDDLPEGFVYVGEVLKNDIYNLPTEEFSAAHLSEGTKIYANEKYTSRKRGDAGDDVYALVDGKYIRLHYYECLIVIAEADCR